MNRNLIIHCWEKAASRMVFCMILCLLRKGEERKNKKKRKICFIHKRIQIIYLGRCIETFTMLLSVGSGVMAGFSISLFLLIYILIFTMHMFYFFNKRGRKHNKSNGIGEEADYIYALFLAAFSWMMLDVEGNHSATSNAISQGGPWDWGLTAGFATISYMIANSPRCFAKLNLPSAQPCDRLSQTPLPGLWCSTFHSSFAVKVGQ